MRGRDWTRKGGRSWKRIDNPGGINPLTDLSKQLCNAFEEPFRQRVSEIAPGLDFGGYDFLEIFDEIAQLHQHGLAEMLKIKTDSGELGTWQPFGPQSV